MNSVLEKEDYYLDPNGNMVFTEIYHKKRGFCCKSGCRHCPFGFGESVDAQVPTEFLCNTQSEAQEEFELAELAQDLLDQYDIE